MSANLIGDDQDEAMQIACRGILRWAQNKAVSLFPKAAWDQSPFEQVASGRSRVAIVLQDQGSYTWALRVEDPDRETAGRIWTTEISIQREQGKPTRFSIRQLVGSPEPSLDGVEPHVPGVVRQLIKTPGIRSGGFQLSDKPLVIKTEEHAELLISALTSASRTLPVIVLTVPSSSADDFKPLLDAKTLAEACAGLAIVVILPANLTWKLTDRFGKQLSVYEGAIRIYQRGFSDDANPFAGHDLILPERFATIEGAARTLKRLRWSAATGSVTGITLGKDLVAFGQIRLKSLEQEQVRLQAIGATESDQLDAAIKRIQALEQEVQEAEGYVQQFSDLHQQAEDRATSAEAQYRAAGFRISQLIDQLKSVGRSPDESIELPSSWDDFSDWCEANLAGRVCLAPQARRTIKSAEYEDIEQTARMLLWLANDLYTAKTDGADGTMRDRVIEPGIVNAHCGSDEFPIEWQGKKCQVDWHIKNNGNTRDPSRCLRIYYFWDESSQQSIVASMPAHRRTDAT